MRLSSYKKKLETIDCFYREMIAVSLLFILSCIYGFSLIKDIDFDYLSNCVYITWLCMLFCSFLSVTYGLKDKDIFSPLIFIFIFEIPSLFQPLVLLSNSMNGVWVYGGGVEDKIALIKYQIFFCLYKLCLVFGYFFGKRLKYKFFAVDENISKKSVLVFFLIGMFGYVLFMFLNGGLYYYISNIYNRRAMGEGKGFIFILIYGLFISGLLYFYKNKFKNIINYTILYYVCIFLILLSLGGRGLALKFIFSLMMFYNYFKKKISLLFFIIIFAFGYIFAGFLGEIRSNTAVEGEGDIKFEVVVDTQELERGLLLVKNIPNEQEYTYFKTYVSLITTLIPRNIYNDKPGLSEAAVYSHLFTGVKSDSKGIYPAGTVAEYYMQAGIYSIIILSFLQGLIVAYVYRFFIRNKNMYVFLLYALFMLSGAYKLRNLGIFQFFMMYGVLRVGFLLSRVKYK